jgi:hypothetical protein
MLRIGVVLTDRTFRGLRLERIAVRTADKYRCNGYDFYYGLEKKDGGRMTEA